MTLRSLKLWLGLLVLACALSTGVALGGVFTDGMNVVAPSNDNFANAIALSGTDATRTGDTNVGATLQPGEATSVAGSPGGASVWYSWTAPIDGVVVIDTTTSGFDTLLGVYTGTSVDTLGEVASNDDFVHPPTSRVRFAANSGTLYRIRVDGYAGATGTVGLHVHQAPPPANDAFASAIVLSTQNATRTGDTNDGATSEPGEADTVAGGEAGASVWYRWTAPVTGNVTIDTATSTFDTLLGVYTGNAVNGLAEVVSNDDVKVPPTSRVRFAATSGTVYRIRVDGYAQQSGTVNLHLQEVLPPGTPANDNFSSAIVLSGSTASRSGDTNAGATLEAGESASIAGEAAAGSVWYTWTAPSTGTAIVDTSTSGYDTLLAAYTGGAVTSLTDVASNDDVSASDLTSSVRFQATAAVTYRIRVDGYSGDTGTINLHVILVPPPANDDLGNAFILSGTNITRTGDTNLGATLQSGEPTTVAGQSAPASTWYSWTAPQNTAVTIDTATSTFDTLLAVYTGSAVNSLTELASNDNVSQSDLTSKVNFGITAGTTYRIRVDGNVGDMGTVNLHLALATVSTIPTNVNAVAGNAQATVSWTPPSSNGGSQITGYDVTSYIGGVAQATTSVGAVTQTTVTGLTNGTTYTFKVAATNVVGTSASSLASNAVTPRTVPDAPTTVTAAASAGQATVSWTAPAFNGGSAITGYDVKRYVNGVDQGTTSVGVVTQTTIGGLTNGTTYTFKVAAKNVAGTGALSAASNAVTPRSVPGVPTGASAVAGGGQATVSWSAPTSDGGSAITGYNVTCYVGGVALGTTTVGVATQTTVTGLTNGTTYTFRISATNALGTGPQSTDSNAVIPMVAPDAPTSVSATAAAGQATVSWTGPAYDGGGAVTGYDVTSYVSGVALGTTSVGVATQTTVGGLTNGVPYTFRVAAKNAAGTGAESAESNSVTPAAPTPPATPKFTLTVAKAGGGSGSVTSSFGPIACGATCAGDYDQGSSVILTATPLSGSTFAGWSGACTGNGSCTVTIDSAKTVTATFKQAEQQDQPQTPSPGGGSKCVVPNVKGKPLATAKRKLTAAHCRLGKLAKAKSKTVPKGKVVAQKPGAGKKLAAGSKVGLVVSAGKP
jgi:hypothetical protein